MREAFSEMFNLWFGPHRIPFTGKASNVAMDTELGRGESWENIRHVVQPVNTNFRTDYSLLQTDEKSKGGLKASTVD